MILSITVSLTSDYKVRLDIPGPQQFPDESACEYVVHNPFPRITAHKSLSYTNYFFSLVSFSESDLPANQTSLTPKRGSDSVLQLPPHFLG
jgi:hypothetical protein